MNRWLAELLDKWVLFLFTAFVAGSFAYSLYKIQPEALSFLVAVSLCLSLLSRLK